MFSGARRHFNAGTIVAIVALVFAMTGGAFAVTSKGGSNNSVASAAKKKKKAKVLRGPAGPRGATGPAGPAGPAGPQGPAGKDGSNGEKGAPGAPGTNGKDGQSVVSASLNPGEEGCTEGGSKFTVGAKTTTACNGEKGEPGQQGPPGTTGFTATLPKGQTETGMWAENNESVRAEQTWFAPLSFSIPLTYAASGTVYPNFHYVRNCQNDAESEGETKAACEQEVKEHETECPGNAAEPRAHEGDMCVYQAQAVIPEEEPTPGVFVHGKFSVNEATLNTSGAVVNITYEGPANQNAIITGTWAVTAP